MMSRLPNSSYYAASAGDFPRQGALIGDHQCDVCIIGGGFTGLSAALSCAEAGLNTILVEAETISDGASGRNGGQLIPGLNMQGVDLIKMLGSEHGEKLYRLAISARDRVHDRIDKHKIDCDLRHGHFHVAAKKSHFAHLEEECAFVTERLGPGVAEMVLPDEVHKYLGVKGYHGGIFIHIGGHFHPLKYAQGLARAAIKAGAKIFEGSRALSVTDSGDVTVQTANGVVKARHAILACDSELGEIESDLGRYAMPVLNYNIATEQLDADRARALIPSGAAVSDSRFVLNYFRVTPDNRLIFAGGEKYTPAPPPDISAFVRPHMLKLFPQLADVAIEYAWGGAVGITINRLPHFGRRGNVLFAHGYSGQGALLTTLEGELMAEAIQGRSERFDLFASIPHNPWPGGKLLRTPLYVAGMLHAAMMDRL